MNTENLWRGPSTLRRGGREIGRKSGRREIKKRFFSHLDLLTAVDETELVPTGADGGDSAKRRTAALYLYFFLHIMRVKDVYSHTDNRSPYPHRHEASSRSSSGTIQG